MPIATPEKYQEMIHTARDGGYAYPAINVTGTETLHGALRGFAEAESDGIVQVSTGGAEFLSGSQIKDMPAGAAALAEFAYEDSGVGTGTVHRMRRRAAPRRKRAR